MIGHDGQVDHAIDLITEIVAMRFGIGARMDFPLDHAGIGPVGNIADRPGQCTEPVKRALRAEQGFDAGDIDQLEIVIERDFAQIDAQRVVIDGAAVTHARGIETAQHHRAGRARAGVRNRHAGGEVGNIANVVDPLPCQLFRTDGGDIDRRIHQRRRAAGGRNDDRDRGRALLLRLLLSESRCGQRGGRKHGCRQQTEFQFCAFFHRFLPVFCG